MGKKKSPMLKKPELPEGPKKPGAHPAQAGWLSGLAAFTLPEPLAAQKKSLAEIIAREEAAGLFAGSPLDDSRLEESILRQLAFVALEKGIRLEEARIEPGEAGVADWAQYIKEYSEKTANSRLASHLLVDGKGALKASPELAGFIRARVHVLAGLREF